MAKHNFTEPNIIISWTKGDGVSDGDFYCVALYDGDDSEPVDFTSVDDDGVFTPHEACRPALLDLLSEHRLHIADVPVEWDI